MFRLFSLRSYALLSLPLALSMFARCQAQITTALTADIPFNFSAGNNTLPAGKYLVTFPSSRFMLLRNVATNQTQSLLSFPSAAKENETARLVFRRYGHASFLTQVWAPGSDGRDLGHSRSEKQLLREMKSVQAMQVQAPLIPRSQASR